METEGVTFGFFQGGKSRGKESMNSEGVTFGFLLIYCAHVSSYAVRYQ